MSFKYSDNFSNKESFLEKKGNYDFIPDVLRLMAPFSLQIIIALVGKTSACIIVGCKSAYETSDRSRR
jgi:hypothetical protein